MTAFSKKLERIGDPSLLQRIQQEILRFPALGDVIQGTGGLRKMREADSLRGKGKRGGFRFIYLDLGRSERTYLFWIYGKNESEDISPDEKRFLRKQVENLKKEAGS